jgi:CRP-like cAMP-binding protein
MVPFGRTALADYLSVDRSAMSRELGNMKKEGLIGTDKNTFTLF